MAEAPPQKSNQKTLIAVVIAVLASMGGADAAGYMPDIQALSQLGIGGAVMLIVYAEMRIRPLLVTLAGQGTAAQLAELAKDLDAKKRPDTDTDPVLEIVEDRPKRTTRPRLTALRVDD
jgi:hypothetical protein